MLGLYILKRFFLHDEAAKFIKIFSIYFALDCICPEGMPEQFGTMEVKYLEYSRFRQLFAVLLRLWLGLLRSIYLKDSVFILSLALLDKNCTIFKKVGRYWSLYGDDYQNGKSIQRPLNKEQAIVRSCLSAASVKRYEIFINVSYLFKVLLCNLTISVKYTP